MATNAPVEVQVVFDASKGRKRRAVRPKRSPQRLPSKTPRRAGAMAIVLGLANVAVAGAFYYATWWKADPEIYLRLVTKTPVPVDIDLEQAAAQILGIRKPPSPKRATPVQGSTRTNQPDAPSTAIGAGELDFPAAKWSGRTTQMAIPIVAYAWLTTSTVSYLLVAMAGGAMLLGGPSRRRVGVVLAVFGVVGLGAGAYYVYSNFGTYRPTDLRCGMGLFALLGVAIGSVLGRGGRKIARAASACLLLAAVVTAAGLYVWGQCGALKAEHFTPQFIAMAFAVHAAWGGVLVVFSRWV